MTGIEPQYFGLGPVDAIRKALTKAGRTFGNLHTVELNEAYAAQALGCLAALPELDPGVLNPKGGAVAIGHPLGASGARITGAVAHQLAQAGLGHGPGRAVHRCRAGPGPGPGALRPGVHPVDDY